MSHILAAKAASEVNKIFDSPMTLTEQEKAFKEFKLKYLVVPSSCGMKMTLIDGKTISFYEPSACWSVDINENNIQG